MLGTILVIVLILLLLGALPTWPYSTAGAISGGGLGLILIIVVMLVLVGRICARGGTSSSLRRANNAF